MHSSLLRGVGGVAVLIVCGAMLPDALVAQGADAPPVVEYRKSIMQGLRHTTGSLRRLVGDQVPFTDHILKQAIMVDALASMAPDVFPEGSTHEESRALPAIWEMSTDFEERLASLREAAASLLAAAESGDVEATGEALRAVNATCRGCHTDFRAR